MPFKDYQKKLEYNHNYVKHYRDNKKGFIQINLNKISKKRLYVCESCFDVGNTQFHDHVFLLMIECFLYVEA